MNSIKSSTFPERLTEGYTSFKENRLPKERTNFQKMAEYGQKPEIMIIACCDSRVSPEVIFDARPGELFVVRNVANLVPPYAPDGELHGTSAALEFAVQALKIKHIIVMGHGKCGGIQAFIKKQQNPEIDDILSPGDFIGKWMNLLTPAIETFPAQSKETNEEYEEKITLMSIQNSIENLLTFPCINILHGKGKLQIHGAIFDVFSGNLKIL